MPHLKLTGYSSAATIEDIFASHMVDVAYLGAANDEYATVFPDDSNTVDLNKTEDRGWLTECVLETMRIAGEKNVSILFVPESP